MLCGTFIHWLVILYRTKHLLLSIQCSLRRCSRMFFLILWITIWIYDLNWNLSFSLQKLIIISFLVFTLILIMMINQLISIIITAIGVYFQILLIIFMFFLCKFIRFVSRKIVINFFRSRQLVIEFFWNIKMSASWQKLFFREIVYVSHLYSDSLLFVKHFSSSHLLLSKCLIFWMKFMKVKAILVYAFLTFEEKRAVLSGAEWCSQKSFL